MPSVDEIKAEIRRKIWRAMDEKRVSRPPRPIEGRIPNFIGAEEACEKVSRLPEFLKALVIKVNPDSPQTHARYLALSMSKIVIMPTPRLREGFLLLDPQRIPRDRLREASTIRGSFTWGGYADLEYGILRELGAVDENTPVITTVHDIQILDQEIPMEDHDLPVDIIVTPSRILRIERAYEKPKGIYWDKLDSRAYREIPVLKGLRDLVASR
ncbi:MAG TPA: 5-formyltetrahydrofolate cyclo-ligase [Sulfolobales archaeon]|nr:5-formyltetrahydrofolate cyclo-ligase [Sulfolobales archaeon]